MNTTLETTAGALILLLLASGCASGGFHHALLETLEPQEARGGAANPEPAQASLNGPRATALRR